MCRPPLDLRVRATNAVNSGEKHKSFSTTPSLQVHIVEHLTVSTTNIDENFDLNQMFLPKVDSAPPDKSLPSPGCWKVG